MLLFCMYFSVNGVPRTLYIRSVIAKDIVSYPDLVSIDEQQVTELHCLFGLICNSQRF